MSTKYVPAHHRHRLLTESQVHAFIDALDRARTAGDAEKAVEQAVNLMLSQGLTTMYGTQVSVTYAHNTDGYFPNTDPGLPYALLVEAKTDLDFSGNKRDVATVLAQVCWYLRAIGEAGDTVPTVTVVCDNDEIFAVPTTVLKKHFTNDGYRWDELAASSMYKDAALMAALIQDSNIRPYVHDVTEDFDAIMFLWAVDAMGTGEEPQRVSVNAKSLEHVFNRFKLEVLGTDAAGLKNKDEIALFIDVLRGVDDVYAHPKKPNTLVWGRRQITLDTYRFEQFWSQYVVGEYTLEQVKSLTEIGDTLIVETDRRFTGDYWTPTIWVDKSHEYIEAALGEDWKSRYVVWDSSWGTGNLTRDYKFDHLFASTLFQEELDIASEYNPEATKFQYDFLNDDMILHEPDMTPDKALELARASKLKMPLPLVEALAANRPIVFYGNPPYGQAGSGQGNKHKAGVNNTAMSEMMDGMGHARMELYTQFIYRVSLFARLFDYTSDFHFFFFFNKTFLTSPNFGKFVDELTSEFTFRDGFMMNAGEFSGTSSAWGIIFSHFEIGGTNQRGFNYAVLESDNDMSINKLTDWRGRKVERGNTISKWLNDVPIGKDYDPEFPVTRNGFEAPTNKFAVKPKTGAIGYVMNDAPNVQHSDKYVGTYTMAAARAHGRDVTPSNIERAAVTFGIRRAVQEVIARQKLLWVRDKDIFTRPPEELLTREFIADCMVYSLFDRQSNQTSLRDYEYKGRTYRVVNEFFPWSRDAMAKLAQEHTNRVIEADATGDGDRLVHTWLNEHEDDTTPEAQAVLDLAWEIVTASFGKRSVFDVAQPRFQVQSWDAGWAQVNAMVFGNKRVDDEVYDKYYAKWRETRQALGDKIAQAAMDAGVI